MNNAERTYNRNGIETTWENPKRMTTETRTTHTPGPWHRESVQIADYPWEVNNGRKVIASVPSLEDARLIAAAPDLLAALEGMLHGTRDNDSSVDDARAAIVKARGQS